MERILGLEEQNMIVPILLIIVWILLEAIVRQRHPDG